ncbi:hypothetical protein J437_LFUL015134 [Ladona fulva]|uniref:Uncharacterized protein n=1 Tax=Ladona fulva TaxID=123851 RepID=A0A8K0KLT2_LADFU|nr:hypothetical protein J437_LFUL015134 [Ladona fulva]
MLTKDGTVYTWGRSLDGQVGNGTRREALFPAPLTSPPPAPPPSAPPPNSSTTLPILTRLRASHIACGCEFTLALDKSSGKLWAWGSNAMAQLGKDLEESSRSAIQGSVVMLKSTKRVIKHPHGVQNSKDLPYLVPWLPPALPTSAPAENISLSSIPQGKEEVPKYGHLTLHKTLEFFHKYYNSQRLLFNCVELENYQAAAKIVALESHFHQALAYQLKALYLASKSSSSPEKEKKTGSGRGGILRVEEEEEDEELSKVGIEAMLRGSRRCETHSFAIQGGAEEMSEGGGGIPSPACPCEEDSDVQLAGKEKGILDRSKGTEGSLMFNGDINAKKEPSTPKSPEKISTVCRQEYVESVRNGLSFGICNVGGNEGNKCGKAVDEPWSEVDEKDKGKTKMSVLKPEEELACRASLVVEHYASLLEEEGHLMIRRLLEQGINFWLAHSLPLSCLETLLIKHMSKFFYPLGLMLFCDWNVDAEEGGEGKEGERSSAPGSVLSQLSTRFCLQLCSTLLSHIRHKKIAYPEYVELLAQVMAMQAAPFGRDNGGGPPATGTPQPPVLSPDIPYTPEHAMEAVLENVGLIGSGIDSLPNPIQVSGDAVMDVLDAEKASCTKEDQEVSESFVLSKKKDQRGVEAVVFSCGHHFRADRFHQSVLPETELALLGLHHPLPHTARLVRGLFSATITPKRASSPTLQLACPNCVLSHLQAQV